MEVRFEGVGVDDRGEPDCARPLVAVGDIPVGSFRYIRGQRLTALTGKYR